MISTSSGSNKVPSRRVFPVDSNTKSCSDYSLNRIIRILNEVTYCKVLSQDLFIQSKLFISLKFPQPHKHSVIVKGKYQYTVYII